jgi:hypothetical protein
VTRKIVILSGARSAQSKDLLLLTLSATKRKDLLSSLRIVILSGAKDLLFLCSAALSEFRAYLSHRNQNNEGCQEPARTLSA